MLNTGYVVQSDCGAIFEITALFCDQPEVLHENEALGNTAFLIVSFRENDRNKTHSCVNSGFSWSKTQFSFVTFFF